jgi:nucleoside-diphosphate-sugar epimerase
MAAQPTQRRILCLGMGYSAQAFAKRAQAQGFAVVGTTRAGVSAPGAIRWDDPALIQAVREADGIVCSIPPDRAGGPDAGLALLAGQALKPGVWIGYLSSTGVYGDLGGAWAFEDMPLAGASARARARIDAEASWRGMGAHIFRLAGIYGPGRSALERVRAGDAQRIIKQGQVFSRIHVDDIAALLLASIARPNPGRVYNACDNDPAPPQDVIAYAAALLGAPTPPDIPFESAQLSQMAAGFYADNRRVSNARAKAELGWRLAYPSYREGLAACLAPA